MHLARRHVSVAEPPPGVAVPGSPPSFEEVYARYAPDVWRMLRRLGVDDAHIEDAAQEVFLIVLRKLDAFEGRSALSTWLYGVALNVARNYRRGARRRDLAVSAAACAETGPSPFPDGEQAARLHLLDRLLEELDEDKREVLVLAEIEQLTAPEISELLGIKLATVYSRLRAARVAFRRAIRRLEGGRR